jgi:hypothetical protein
MRKTALCFLALVIFVSCAIAENKTEPLPPNQNVQQKFIKEYQELCDKTGYTLVAIPSFIQRDDGTFSIVINYKVVELPKKEEKEK